MAVKPLMLVTNRHDTNEEVKEKVLSAHCAAADVRRIAGS